jgi:hypothetical protein
MPYRNDGFSVVCPFDDALPCGLNHTMAIRMVNRGEDVRRTCGRSDPHSGNLGRDFCQRCR